MGTEKYLYYQSHEHGLSLSIGEEFPLVVFKSKPTVLFDDNGVPVQYYNVFKVEKSNTKLIKALEATEAFKRGAIFRMKTPQMISEEKRIAESKKYIENLKRDFGVEELKKLIESKKANDLYAMANNFGVSIYKDEIGEVKKDMATIKKEILKKLEE